MPCPLPIFSQSDYLIQIIDIKSYMNDKQCRSRSVGLFRSQLIWIYTVCKDWAYPGSAGQGLILFGCKKCLTYRNNPKYRYRQTRANSVDPDQTPQNAASDQDKYGQESRCSNTLGKYSTQINGCKKCPIWS